MDEFKKMLADRCLGGPGYREHLAERFTPETAKHLQAVYDKLATDFAADVLRNLSEALAVQNETPLDAGMRVSAGENAPVVDSDEAAERLAWVKSLYAPSR